MKYAQNLINGEPIQVLGYVLFCYGTVLLSIQFRIQFAGWRELLQGKGNYG